MTLMDLVQNQNIVLRQTVVTGQLKCQILTEYYVFFNHPGGATCLNKSPSVINNIFVFLLLLRSNRIWYPTSLPYSQSISWATRLDSEIQAILLG